MKEMKDGEASEIQEQSVSDETTASHQFLLRGLLLPHCFLLRFHAFSLLIVVIHFVRSLRRSRVNHTSSLGEIDRNNVTRVETVFDLYLCLEFESVFSL